MSPSEQSSSNSNDVLKNEFDVEALSKAHDATADTPPASIRSADTLEQRLHDVIAFVAEKWPERGSATETEEHTAQFVSAELKAMGLVPQSQNFLGLTSTYSPYILAAGLTLLTLFLFWRTRDSEAMAIAALVLLAVVIAALVYELSLRDNVLRWWLSPEYSQNVFVQVPPAVPAAMPAAVPAPCRLQNRRQHHPHYKCPSSLQPIWTRIARLYCLAHLAG